MSDLEVHNLPLVARNPYNFALVQPGVTGYENVEFGVPRLAANGAAMRINYMIDGNTNTEKDRAGLRLLPMSEVMIQEVKVVTTGFAPEFGQTMGMVYNAVTPSGTNTFKGEGELSVPPQAVQRVSVLLRLRQHDARGQLPGDARPTSRAARDEGRPGHGRRRRPDRQEQAVLLRRLGADAPRPVVDQPDHGRRRRSSRSSASSRSPTPRRTCRPAKFAIGKGDYQIDNNNRLTRPLDAVPQRRAVQQRRRHRHARARHQLPRRDGLERRPARVVARLEQAERAALPVRAPAPGLGRERAIRAPARRSRSARRAVGVRRRRVAAPARATPASTSSRTSRR